MKIILDPGHGGDDSGAVFHGLKEKDITLDVCLAAIERLQLFHWTALTRTTDMYVPLDSRTKIANWWKADLFISVHCNADPDSDLPGMPEARGEEIWVHPGSLTGLHVANTIKGHVDEFFPEHKFRGVKESKGLYVLRRTQMPALLIETGFLDNVGEYGAFKGAVNRRRIGLLLARGILNYDKGVKPK